MSYVLNLVYLLVLLIASPWLLWQAATKRKYREGWAAKMLGLVPQRAGRRTCVWLHAVSVGEVNLLGTLLEAIARHQPEWECVVSTTTMTGYAVARRKHPTLSVFYCPLDFTWAVQRAMRRVRPNLLVLAELELWPNLIAAARRHGAKVAVINGRLSAHSHAGYRRIRPLVRRVLANIDLIAVQDRHYAERFTDLGAPASRLVVTGSMKYDGAQTDRANPTTQRLAALAGFHADDIVLLAGSTQQTEEAAALAAYQAHVARHPRLRLVLVPRHPERFDAVARLLEESGLHWQRRSRLETDGANPAARILLVDAVGELAGWWGTAHIGFVGGSLTQRGGQNMIEPAAYGAAVSFGPNTHNFRDIVDALLAADAACVVADEAELTRFVGRCLDDADYAATLGRRAQALVESQLGATQRTLTLLAGLIGTPGSQRAHRNAA